MKSAPDQPRRSQKFLLRLRKFRATAKEQPRIITITEPEDSSIGVCLCSNDEKLPYNSLTFHLGRVQIHTRLPKFLKPLKLPSYVEIGVDPKTSVVKRGWRNLYYVKVYAVGYHLGDKFFYLFNGSQIPDELSESFECCRLREVKR